MKYILIILITVLSVSFQSDKIAPYYNKKKEPTTWGINDYILKNQDNIVKEYEYFIEDTLIFEIDIWTEDFSKFSDGKALGEFYFPNQIYITNEERYIDYEFHRLSKFKQRFLPYTERTVKAVIFHELTHAYIYQIIYNMIQENRHVCIEYKYNLRILPRASSKLGATFIEEGICEYVVYYLKESVPLGNVYVPKNEKELLDESYYINNVYQYSVYYLKDFLDKHGIKRGIEILISNEPPNYEEILNRDLFFKRLIINEEEKNTSSYFWWIF